MNLFWFTIIILRLRFCHTLEDGKVSQAYIVAGDQTSRTKFFYHTNLGEIADPSNIISEVYSEERINETGWASLRVKSNGNFLGHLQAFWSGFLETNVTYRLTEAHWNNTFRQVKTMYGGLLAKLLEPILQSNMQFMLNRSIENKNSTFWYPLYLHLWQLRGIEAAFQHKFVFDSAGLNDAYLRELEKKTLGIYLLQLSGDIWTFLRIATVQIANQLRQKTAQAIKNRQSGSSCSLFIKVVENDILIGHVTWAPYATMLRVLKRYEFPWKKSANSSEVVNGHTIVFSSYPSVTFSMDDFYITNQKMVVSETTIPIYNVTLWDYVLPNINKTLMTFTRAMLANRRATTTTQWAKTFEQLNSGTFNNEWLVFDGKLFESVSDKSELIKDTLLIVAQIPGKVLYDDVTDNLKVRKYFAGFNVPYQQAIYNASGYNEQEAINKDGYYSRVNTTRNIMFDWKNATVTNLTTMHHLMRYNNYTNDPLSTCQYYPNHTATKAISSRKDLNDIKGNYSDKNYGFDLYGGTDVKIVNMTMINKMEMMATSGPTFDSLPPFNWSEIPDLSDKPNIPKNHALHPEVFKFYPIFTNLQGTPQQELAHIAQGDGNAISTTSNSKQGARK